MQVEQGLQGKRLGRWDGDELVVDVERRQEETGEGLAMSGSQAWGVGSVRRAGTGNFRLGRAKALWSERLQTTQTCCLGQLAEEQLLYQDHSSQIWLRKIIGLGRLGGTALPPVGALAILLGAASDSRDDGVKN